MSPAQPATGLILESSGSNYHITKSPVALEAELLGGALRPGGAPSIYSRQYIGVLAHFAAIGVVYATINGVIYSVLNDYLYMSTTLVATARALVRVPHALRVFTAIFSDCCPLFGYRRRPYLMLGWSISFAACLAMAVIPLGKPYYTDSSLEDIDVSDMTPEQLETINFDAPHRGTVLIVLFMVAHLGTILAYGAADGLIVELAQREPEHIRGTVQSISKVTSSSFSILASFMTGLGLDSVAYGGTFSWTMGFNGVMWVCAIFSLAAVPISWYFIDEPHVTEEDHKPLGKFLREIYNLLYHRVYYQILGFVVFSLIFSSISVTSSSAIQSTYAGVTPLNSGIASMLSSALAALAINSWRLWGLQWNWRYIIIVCTVTVVVIDAFPTFFTIWNVYRSQWFWLGIPLIEEFPSTIGDFVSTLFVVEISDPGQEATVMGLLISTRAISGPFATVLYKNIDSTLDIGRKFIAKDNREVHLQLTYAYLISYAFQLLSLVFLFLLPSQKAAAHELKLRGGTSKWWGRFTAFYLLFACCWIVMTNVLSLFDSTSCLRIAGGTGC
jgi:MFS family permease